MMNLPIQKLPITKMREAHPHELNQVYMMGYDCWADGESRNVYLAQCAQSAKYKSGTWYVFEVDGKLVSSLIAYAFLDDCIGVGSIATDLLERRKGYASKLLKEFIRLKNKQGTRAIYLHSDIGADFYQRLGFSTLSKEYQINRESVCMVWGQRQTENDDGALRYF
jgi:predicted acetyltransferase